MIVVRNEELRSLRRIEEEIGNMYSFPVVHKRERPKIGRKSSLLTELCRLKTNVLNRKTHRRVGFVMISYRFASSSETRTEYQVIPNDLPISTEMMDAVWGKAKKDHRLKTFPDQSIFESNLSALMGTRTENDVVAFLAAQYFKPISRDDREYKPKAAGCKKKNQRA
ncbi:hypothetical protein QAD02_001456 [Eretmocerus hayati]|uniref:Uncharacterized protein n=1 Tax=Eretmocerus hayati TaxID=131215 RepID=A0ACC2NIX6_9HYME|nr:hypothetical protein QAD02_001456 [Eretmocerus hayati]